jgi:uncharacterized protein (TIGR02145 family)
MKEVKIGSQVWAKEDLKVMRFRNGDEIPVVQDQDSWASMTRAAMCINPDTGVYLYNWYAVNDKRGLAPEGWHIPSDEEWKKLTTYLGGENLAGKAMKSSPSDTPSWNGTNSSGFSALPGGTRGYNGYFGSVGNFGVWWSSSPSWDNAWYRNLGSGNDAVGRGSSPQEDGISVRCIKDEVVCKQPKEDLKAKFDKHIVRVDAHTEEMHKKFAELTSRLDAMAVQMTKLQGSMDSLLKSKK